MEMHSFPWTAICHPAFEKITQKKHTSTPVNVVGN